jgi:hypothetical protein
MNFVFYENVLKISLKTLYQPNSDQRERKTPNSFANGTKNRNGGFVTNNPPLQAGIVALFTRK